MATNLIKVLKAKKLWIKKLLITYTMWDKKNWIVFNLATVQDSEIVFIKMFSKFRRLKTLL